MYIGWQRLCAVSHLLQLRGRDELHKIETLLTTHLQTSVCDGNRLAMRSCLCCIKTGNPVSVSMITSPKANVLTFVDRLPFLYSSQSCYSQEQPLHLSSLYPSAPRRVPPCGSRLIRRQRLGARSLPFFLPTFLSARRRQRQRRKGFARDYLCDSTGISPGCWLPWNGS